MGDTAIPLQSSDGDQQANGEVVQENQNPEDTTCGVGRCRPKWVQPLANIKLFTASLALLVAFYGAQSTYVVSVLTTIEKAFGFPSSKSGFITSTNDIGFLITVVPVSYMASRAHKPVVIGVSGLFIGASGVLSALPYFIWGGGMEETQQQGVEVAVKVNKQLNPQMALLESSLCHINNETTYGALNATDQCGTESEEVAARSTGAYVMLVIAQVIIGIAASTLWSLGMTFIDDNVKKHVSSIYLGILFSLRTLSPILGFVLGAVFTSKPVDLRPTSLTPLDPQWVGAWWVGFLACGIIIFLAGIPLLIFPRQLPAPKEDPEKRRKKEEKRAKKKPKKRPFNSPMMMGGGGGGSEEKVDFKGFVLALKRIFTSRVYALIAISDIFGAFGMIAFFTFLPKYIETQFDLTASQASMVLVVTSALPAAIGTFSSGFMTSKLHMGLVELARCNGLIGLVTVLLRMGFIWLGCSVTPVKGLGEVNGYNFTDSCNLQCDCSTENIRPVCGSDGVSYFSACHAGCSVLNSTTFQNCTCIPDGYAVTGQCRDTCHMLIPFCIILFTTALLSGLGMMPGVMLLIRAVEDRDKTLAIGVLMFLFAIVGIPAPVVFGDIIDQTCLFHGGKLETCQVYEKFLLRTRMLGVSIGIGSIPAIISLYIWWFLTSKKKKELGRTKTEVVNNDIVVTYTAPGTEYEIEHQTVV